MHYGLSPLDTDCVALPLAIPLGSIFKFSPESGSYGKLTLTRLPSEFLTHCNLHPCWKNRENTKQQGTVLPFFFYSEMKIKETNSKIKKMIKQNSPGLGIRITSVH